VNTSGQGTSTPQSPNNTSASLTIDSVATDGRKSTFKKAKDIRQVLALKQPGKTSLLTTNLAFSNSQTVHTFDLKSLTPTVTVERELDNEEVKPSTELKEVRERAPLNLAQRGNVVSLLSEQRRESSQPTTTSDLDASRSTIVVTSAHNFSGQPTYLMTGYYRGQDGQDYVETGHEVQTEKIYKL